MKQIAWIISPPAKGSGGFRTICSKASFLDSRGYENYFYIMPGCEAYKSAHRVQTEIKDWFGYSPKEVLVAPSVPEDFFAVIATAWNTAHFASMQKCAHKFYFIQDFEPWFYPMGEMYLNAEASYRYELNPITIGRWLSKKVEPYYSHEVPYCDFGVSDIYTAQEQNLSREYAVCAIYQSNKDRRLSGMLLDAIKLLLKLDDAVVVYLYGEDTMSPIHDSRVRSLGILTADECASLYAKCVAGVSLSVTNPSRLPFEMLASKLSVIEINRENNLLDFPEGTIHLAEPSACGIASSILEVLSGSKCDSPNRFSCTSIERENEMFLEAITRYLNEEPSLASGKSAFGNVLKTEEQSKVFLLSDRLADARLLSSAMSQTLIQASSVDLTVRFESSLVPVDVRAAVWRALDQSDIRWISLESRDGHFAGHVPLFLNDDEEAYLRIHIYSFAEDGKNPLCVAELSQLVCLSPSRNAHPVVRSVESGACSVSAVFNLSDEYCEPCQPSASTGVDGGHVALLKRLFRRN